MAMNNPFFWGTAVRASVVGSMGALSLLALPLLASAQSYSSAYSTTYPVSYPVQSGCYAFTQYLRLGSSDAYTAAQVTQLQQLLNTLGYLRGVSGYFDQGTYGAVMNFQRDRGIYSTGTVGPLTRAALNQTGCSGVVPGPISPYPVPDYNLPGYLNQNTGLSISSLSMSSGVPGNSVTIYGSNLAAYNPTVRFGTQSVPVAASSYSNLTFIVPSLPNGTYQVYVTNGYGSSNSLTFVITGQNGTNCYWNGNAYQCNCDYSYGSYYNGNQNCNSQYNSSGTWFGSGSQPRISGIAGPSSVGTGSNTTWSVQAYNAVGQPYTVSVDWGDGTSAQSSQSYGTNQQNYSFSHTYLNSGSYTIRFTATDPSGSFSYTTLPISVYGSSYNNGYYGYGTPTISYLSATTASRGSTIVITGSNFSPNTTVLIGGNSYTASSYNNGTSISFIIPTYLGTGSYPVSVRNNSGQTSNSVTLYVQW
jgi:peptidoglycan hydrolase-like protein with peptidoglycan-binding domain